MAALTQMRRHQSRAERDRRLAEIRAAMAAAATALPAGEKDERLARAGRDPLWFGQTYLPHYFTAKPAAFHREILRLADHRPGYVAIAAPRGHAKSTILTLAYILHQVLFVQRRFVVVISENEDDAGAFLEYIRLELEENERLRGDFGNQVNRGQWEDKDFTTRAGIRVLARGVRQTVRGLRNRQHRPDLVVLDDFEDDEVVRNPRRVKQGYEWVTTAVIGGMERAGTLVAIGTLLAKSSILGLLMANEQFASRVYRALGDDGHPLWPAHWPAAELLARKAVIGNYAFNREYQNDPQDPEGPFQLEWIEKFKYDPAELRGRPLRIVSYVDPAVGKDAGDDCFHAIVTVAVDLKTLVYYVVDAWIRRTPPAALVAAMYASCAENRPLALGAEGVAFQDWLRLLVANEVRAWGFQLPLRMVTPRESKEDRILGLSPYVQNGTIRFCPPQGDQALLIEQLTGFPRQTVKKDGPDALEGAYKLAGEYIRRAGPIIRSGGPRRAASIAEGY